MYVECSIRGSSTTLASSMAMETLTILAGFRCLANKDFTNISATHLITRSLKITIVSAYAGQMATIIPKDLLRAI